MVGREITKDSFSNSILCIYILLYAFACADGLALLQLAQHNQVIYFSIVVKEFVLNGISMRCVVV